MNDFFDGKYIIAASEPHICHLCSEGIPVGVGYFQERDPVSS